MIADCRERLLVRCRRRNARTGSAVSGGHASLLTIVAVGCPRGLPSRRWTRSHRTWTAITSCTRHAARCCAGLDDRTPRKPHSHVLPRADGSGVRVPRATAGGVGLAGKRRYRGTREGVSLAADRSGALLGRGGQASAGAQPVPPVHGSGRRGTAQRDRQAAGNLGRPPAVSVYVPT